MQAIAKETIDKNLEGIKSQVDKIFDGKAEIVNNYDWIKDLTLIDYLRDYGKLCSRN